MTEKKILALDVGTRRIGLAVSDGLGLTAQGLDVLERRSLEQDLTALRRVISEQAISMLLLGLPLNMDGTMGSKAMEIKGFGEILKKELDMPIDYQDERLSTRAVEETLIAADVRRNKRRKVVDKLAAVYILQGYLDRKNAQKKRSFVDKEAD